MVTINQGVQDKLAALKKAKEVSPAAVIPTSAPETTKTLSHIPGSPLPAPTPEPEEREYHVYYHTLKSCRMITREGRTISFVDGRYVTDVESEIAYLDEELALKNYQLSVVPGEEVMTTSQLDPMKALKKQFIAEYLEEEAAKAAAKTAGTLPESSSTPQQLTPGSTRDTGVTAAGSVSLDS